ncbi:hypothetical protein M758_1G284100 [Ceratodon purpureus]|nr:hypothetical protein M758_1G284100 [Ceratodon purpureus]
MVENGHGAVVPFCGYGALRRWGGMFGNAEVRHWTFHRWFNNAGSLSLLEPHLRPAPWREASCIRAARWERHRGAGEEGGCGNAEWEGDVEARVGLPGQKSISLTHFTELTPLYNM